MEDLVKKGILKEGEINRDSMIDSPEKTHKALFNISIFITGIIVVGIIAFIVGLIWMFWGWN